MRIEEVVAVLAEAMGVRASLTFVPAPPGHQEIGVMDIDRAKEIWKFEPQVALPAGVAQYAQWYRASTTRGIR